MNANRQLPFDVDDPEVQRACRAVARLLMDDAGDEEARRTVLAVMIAAMGDEEAESRGPLRPRSMRWPEHRRFRVSGNRCSARRPSAAFASIGVLAC